MATMRVVGLCALLALALCAVAAPLAGCRQEELPGTPAPAPGAPPAAADERPLTFAVLPERNVFEQRKRFEHLQEYLARTLGRPVAITLLDGYPLLFDELLLRRADGAFFASMSGAIALARDGVEMLARPVDLDGLSSHRAVLFAARGSGVTKDPRTWRGRRAAFAGTMTTAGHLYPLVLLRRAGYRDGAERHVGKLIYAGSQDAALLAVLEGEADFGATKSDVYDDYLREHPADARRLVRLDESAPVPSSALGVRRDLDPGTKRALRGALLGMHLREEGREALRGFGAQRFVETSPADYDPVFALAREAGVDLASWSPLEGRRPRER